MEDLDIFRKRLLYLSQHRGLWELDYLLGKFAQNHIGSMDYEALNQFESFLSFSDQDLYGWFFENKPTPQNVPQSFIEAIQKEQKSGVFKNILSPEALALYM